MSGQMPLTALIGFGEAGSTFARAGAWGPFSRAYDISEVRRAVASDCGVAATASPDEALAGAAIALSLVTADSALGVARDYARFLKPSAIWCDMNSVAPDTKRAAAQAIEAAGGRYVDVAVMAPVDPK
ncbi:MAG: NAD(P)-dependent oxidoreductase, partial [Oxalobacteraceae bacterium]